MKTKRFAIELLNRVLMAVLLLVFAPLVFFACASAGLGALIIGTKAMDDFFETFRWYFEKEQP